MRALRPATAFVLGGRGLTVEDQMRAEVQVCSGISEAMETVDGLIKRAGSN